MISVAFPGILRGAPNTLENFPIPTPPSLWGESAATATPPAGQNRGGLVAKVQFLPGGNHLCTFPWFSPPAPGQTGSLPGELCVFSPGLAHPRGQARKWRGGQVSDFVHPLVINYLLDPLA